ncbi:MAG: hypothetical protein JNJ83_11780 [Verrucomicrobiaceae bacterium]|nr:hypothetical protein [Verrucomicrobiaceae bacterium]
MAVSSTIGWRLITIAIQSLALYHLAQFIMEEDRRTARRIAVTYLCVTLTLRLIGFDPHH